MSNKLVIKTLLFQTLLSTVLKGASSDKIRMITDLLHIKLNNGELKLTVTDGNNYVVVSQKGIEGEDFDLVVAYELFSKLIMKCTSEYISLIPNEEFLEVVADGSYKINLPADVTGEDYPDPQMKDSDISKELTLDPLVMKKVINANTKALATTLEEPAMTGYYFDEDKVISTNGLLATFYSIKTLDTKLLISPKFLNLFSLFTDKEMKIQICGSDIEASCGNITIYGKAMPEISDYPINEVNSILGTEYLSTCQINKNKLLSTIERLALFVESYEQNSVYINFKKSSMIVRSRSGNTATEELTYEKSIDNFNDEWEGLMDVNFILDQLNSNPSEVVNISFGHPAFIKIEGGNLIQLVSLTQEV